MKLRELIAKKNALATEALALVKEGKNEDAESKKVEIENLNKSIELLIEIEDEANKNSIENEATPPVAKKPVEYNADIFINLFQNGINPNRYHLTEEAAAIQNAFVEDPSTVATKDEAPNGASIALPVDVQNDIIEIRKSFPSLENLVSTERVGYLSGSRIVELNSALAPFPSVDEGQLFPDAPKPGFKKVTYEVKKYGDILKFTYEMVQDAPQVLSYVKRWFAKRGVATRNALILAALDAEYTAPTAVTGIDDFKDIINVEIPVAEALSISLVTNQDGFNALDKMKDLDGNYILEKDPTNATKGKLLFGKHPVLVLDNAILNTRDDDGTKHAPIYVGDMKEAVRVFDREQGTIDYNDRGTSWNSDMIDMKGRERLDVKVVDPTAVVKAEIAL
jgi:HK97 family phage major capsid protein